MSDEEPISDLGLSQRDLEMAGVNTPNKESQKFDFDRFKSEESPEARIALAEDYIAHADNDWARIYRAKSHRIFEETQSSVEINEPEADSDEEKEGDLEPFFRFVDIANSTKGLEDKGAPEATIARESAEQRWQVLVDSLKSNTSATTIKETLDWIKNKAYSRELIVANAQKSASKKDLAALQRLYQANQTPMLHFRGSEIGPNNPDFILIFEEALSKNVSQEALLILLAHERAHELLSKYYTPRSDKKIDSNTQIVFEEFYPMLEERRMYESLDEEAKKRLPPTIRNRYDEVGTSTGGSNQDIPVQVLERAYVHSIDMIQRNKLKEGIKSYYAMGLPQEQVNNWRDEMLKILHKHEPVGGKQE